MASGTAPITKSAYDVVLVHLWQRDLRAAAPADTLMQAAVACLHVGGTALVFQPQYQSGLYATVAEHTQHIPASASLFGLPATHAPPPGFMSAGDVGTLDDVRLMFSADRLQSAFPRNQLQGHVEKIDAQVDLTRAVRSGHSGALSELFDDTVTSTRSSKDMFTALLDRLSPYTLFNVDKEPEWPVLLHMPLLVVHITLAMPVSCDTSFLPRLPSIGQLAARASEAASAALDVVSRSAPFTTTLTERLSSMLSSNKAFTPLTGLPASPFALPSLAYMRTVPGLMQYGADGTAFLNIGHLVDTVAAPSTSSAAVDVHGPASGGAGVPSTTAAAVASAVVQPASAFSAPRPKHRARKVLVELDAWHPHGTENGFFNAGLANWHQQRKEWTKRRVGYAHPPYPPIVDLDSVIDELNGTIRTVELPGPVRLPDMIDCYLDCWSPLSDD
ncbi:hypothetical protein EON66_09975, partial [archaeon]